MTCDTCKCNKVCDHNRYGFENCDSYISTNCVETVRCRECKHYVASYCTRDIKGRTNMFYMLPYDFCSYGVRRKDE